MSQERKPFHEAVVKMIADAEIYELQGLAKILMITIIPKGHQEIADAWRKKCKELKCEISSEFVADEILKYEKEFEKKQGNSHIHLKFLD